MILQYLISLDSFTCKMKTDYIKITTDICIVQTMDNNAGSKKQFYHFWYITKEAISTLAAKALLTKFLNIQFSSAGVSTWYEALLPNWRTSRQR